MEDEKHFLSLILTFSLSLPPLSPSPFRPSLFSTCPISSAVACLNGKVQWKSDDGIFPWYWGEVTQDTEVHACWNTLSCITNGDGSSVTCNTNAGYYGPLCGACDRDNEQGLGSFTRSGYVCAKCSSTATNILVVAALMIGIVIVAVYVSGYRRLDRRVDEYGGILRRLAFSYIQMLGVLGIFKARGTKHFHETVSESSQVAGGSLTAMISIKCLLNSQSYGPFLLNMALPILLSILTGLVMFPTTLVKKCLAARQRASDVEMAERRERVSSGRLIPSCAPLHEPIVDLGNVCCKVPTHIALACAWCRKPAGEEYIANAERKERGLPMPNPPKHRPRLTIEQRACGGIPYSLLMACKCCRVKATEEEQRTWRAAYAVRKQGVKFKPNRRFVAVLVLIAYTAYPTLVASTAAIFSCTEKIYGTYAY